MKKVYITENILRNDRLFEGNKLAVMLSGGMDSALLLYLITKTFSNPIQPYTIPKTDGAANYVNGIITWINRRLNSDLPNAEFIGNPNLYHGQIVGDAIHQIRGKFHFLYLAGNAYPNDILSNGPERIRIKNHRIQQPFFDCYKTDIVQAYLDFDLMELLPLTHTCTEQAIGRCNNCWQCRERNWAFNQLNLIDNTTT